MFLNRRFKIAEYYIKAEKLSLENEHTIVVLADLHNKTYGEDNSKLLLAIKKIDPEFILVAGDILVAKPGRDMGIAISLMQKLSQEYQVYYGNGNHEYRLRIYPETYGRMYEQYTESLKAAGICLLENQSVEIQIEGKPVKITGLEIDRSYYKRFKSQVMTKEYLEELLGPASDKAYQLLIAHNPQYFKTYAQWGADLTVAGHVHGGIMRLPFIGGVISPQLRLFPKYDGGIYDLKGKKMVLSRGLGTHTIDLRIFNPPELVVIKLK